MSSLRQSETYLHRGTRYSGKRVDVSCDEDAYRDPR